MHHMPDTYQAYDIFLKIKAVSHFQVDNHTLLSYNVMCDCRIEVRNHDREGEN